jgi:hypothetical protein
MNKQTTRIAAVLFAVLVMVLTGCVTAGIVDTSIPMSEQCVLLNGDIVKAFDDKVWDTPRKPAAVIIPAGRHSIGYAFEKSITISSSTTGNITTTTYIPYTETGWLAYDFEAGKNYQIHVNSPGVSVRNGILVSSQGEISFADKKAIVFNSNMSITEEKSITGIHGNVYIGPEYDGNISLGWMYHNTPGVDMIPRLGIGIIAGKFNMKIMGELALGIGMLGDNDSDDPRSFTLPYHTGAMAEFYFPKFGGLGFGGGMADDFTYRRKNERGEYLDGGSELFTFWRNPATYVELDYIFVRTHTSIRSNAIFARYYFVEHDPKLLTTLGFGLRFAW